MEFRFSTKGWKVLGALPKIKKEMKLEAIKLVPAKDADKAPFVIFVQKDGSYATASYDNKAKAPLQDCFLYQLPDGDYTVGPRYTNSDSNVLDSL